MKSRASSPAHSGIPSIEASSFQGDCGMSQSLPIKSELSPSAMTTPEVLYQAQRFKRQILIDHVNGETSRWGKQRVYTCVLQFFHDKPFFIGKFLADGFNVNLFGICCLQIREFFQLRIFKKYHQQQMTLREFFQVRQLAVQRVNAFK